MEAEKVNSDARTAIDRLVTITGLFLYAVWSDLSGNNSKDKEGVPSVSS